MRQLYLCRGVAGCGKSTFLREHNITRYTINADEVRLLFQSPILQPDGSLAISQKNDSRVWELIMQLVEERMARGEFTIVDATHSRATQINDYRKLCEKYRYRCYVLDFSDTPLEVILARNASRLNAPSESHKYVPEGAIHNMYERIQTQPVPGWVTKVKPSEYDDSGELQLFDYNQYNRVHIIGDLHGCLAPLLEYVNSTNGLDSPVDAWIFVGDYVDRGVQNRKLVEFLMGYRDRKNILFLAGNHEIHLNLYANDEIDSIMSAEFRNNTMPYLDGIDKKELREWCRRFAQVAWFRLADKLILVNHGGLPCVPTVYTATDQIIKGTGVYEDAETTQQAWLNYASDNMFQVHGHRNVFDQPLQTEGRIYNLCDRVEYGGYLRVVCFEKEYGLANGIHTHLIKNNTYAPPPTITKKLSGKIDMSVADMMATMRNMPKRIQEKRFNTQTGLNDPAGHISSFNFTRDVFYDSDWDAATTLARGMFVNNTTGKIVARGYEKFFNINERSFTKVDELRNMQWPVEVYKKENGFLGLVGYDWESELPIIATKSSLTGDYVQWFKEAMPKHTPGFVAGFNYAGCNECFVFECVDPVNDPHIIEYNEPHVVLLDIIKRDVNYSKMSYYDVAGMAKHLNVNVKQHITTLNSYREFYEFYRDTTNYDYQLNGEYVEGFVYEDSAGFMTKGKTGYYNMWKFMRSVKDTIKGKRPVEMAKFTTALQNSVVAWMKQQPKEVLELDIIQVRKLYLESVK